MVPIVVALIVVYVVGALVVGTYRLGRWGIEAAETHGSQLLQTVPWDDILQALGLLGLGFLVLVGVLVGMFVVVALAWPILVAREEARQRKQRYQEAEMGKPRVPELGSLTEEQQEELRRFNKVIRPDLEDLERVRRSRRRGEWDDEIQ